MKPITSRTKLSLFKDIRNASTRRHISRDLFVASGNTYSCWKGGNVIRFKLIISRQRWFKTVLNHLEEGWIQKKLEHWVPHEFDGPYISICESLAERHKIDPFLKRMTGWWLGMCEKVVMLGVWWDWKEVIQYDLLQSLTSDFYYQSPSGTKQLFPNLPVFGVRDHFVVYKFPFVRSVSHRLCRL